MYIWNAVGPCLHCTGGSSFGVSLLGGVRNRNGELQTFVTSVDERCHHEDGSGIKEGVHMHYMVCVSLCIVSWLCSVGTGAWWVQNSTVAIHCKWVT